MYNRVTRYELRLLYTRLCESAFVIQVLKI
nr:MAG TPA: hypothetical protein [Caudoviricetes sp.]